MLLADYTRRGFFDGIGLRLPTICVRPGKPNKAASGFFSGIIREPLAGEEAILPVPDTVRHGHASPRAAVGFLIHAATLDTSKVGPRRNLAMPSVSVTVAEQIEALKRVAGAKVAARIKRKPDPLVERIVSGWPQAIEGKRARELGFRVGGELRRNHQDAYRGRARRQDRGLSAMRFSAPLIPATLKRRYKRFLADVTLAGRQRNQPSTSPIPARCSA